jgi:hypothetical protein
MAKKSRLNSQTVAQIRAAIERDIAFLTMSPDAQWALKTRVMGMTGDGSDFPDLRQLNMNISPQAEEAARILVALLLGRAME